MESCEIPTKDILIPNVVHLDIDQSRCDFECAKEAALDEARSYDNAPKLVSWFDKRHQSFYPEGECCVEGEPSWLSYGAANGADLTIDIGNEDYVFMFRKSHGSP